jgi:hypothetical protein
MRHSVLPADKFNAALVLSTLEYILKIAALLEDKTYRLLKRVPSDSVERKTFLLLKKSPIAEEACQQLRPQCLRPLRLYGFPMIQKPDVSLRPIFSTIVSPTPPLAKHITCPLSSHPGKSPHHVRN